MMTSMSVAYSASFNPVLHKSYYVPNETTNLMLTKLAHKRPHLKCCLMISMSIVHSLSLSSPGRITNSVHYESFKNWICLKIAGNYSNDLFHDDFDVSGIFR